jgi:hypothetical protein
LNAIAAFEVVVTDPALVPDAHLLAEREQLAWFDALIVEAAIRNACTILCSEDFAARSPVFESDGSESLPDPRLIRVVRRRDMHAHSKQLRRARAAFLSDGAPALNACTTAVHSVGSFRLPF